MLMHWIFKKLFKLQSQRLVNQIEHLFSNILFSWISIDDSNVFNFESWKLFMDLLDLSSLDLFTYMGLSKWDEK
jgi:hypothetical protein